MKIVSLLFFILSIGLSQNQGLEEMRQVCYGIEDKADSSVVLSVARNDPLPNEMTMFLVTYIKSQHDDSVLRTLKKQLKINKIKGLCKSSIGLVGYTSEEIYRTYEISFHMINSNLTLNRFVFDIYNKTTLTDVALRGMYGKATLKINYSPLDAEPVEQETVVRSYPSSVYLVHACLFLRHEGLGFKLPIHELWEAHSKILHEAIQTRFTYKVDGKDQAVIVYDSWMHPCVQTGSLKFDFVVNELINNSQVLVEFLSWNKAVLGRLEYNISISKSKLLMTDTTLMDIDGSVTTLEEALKNKKDSHIYLDKFEMKIIDCEYLHGVAKNVEVHQFGHVRYHTHLFPEIDSTVPTHNQWRHLSEDELVELLASEKTKCTYLK